MLKTIYVSLICIALLLPSSSYSDVNEPLMSCRQTVVDSEVGQRSQVVQVRDQGRSNSCYLCATMAILENKISQNIEAPLALSTDYVLYLDLLIHAVSRMNVEWSFITPEGYFIEGGSLGRVALVVRRYGLVPEKVWQPATPAFSVLEGLQKKIYQIVEDFYRRKPDEYTSPNTVFDMRTEKSEYVRVYVQKVIAEIEKYAGPLPFNQEFMVEDEVHTPMSFAQTQLQFISQPTILVRRSEDVIEATKEQDLIVVPDRDDSFLSQVVEGEFDRRVVNLGFNHMVKVIDRKLAAGDLVYISYLNPTGGATVDHNTGLSVLNGRADLSPIRGEGVLHAVVVTRRILRSDGFKGYEVLNSYGASSGSDGYYYLSDDFLLRYLRGIELFAE